MRKNNDKAHAPAKDNSTLWDKVKLRRSALEQLSNPIVMETHGGEGHLFRACYSEFTHGVVFEKDPRKTAILAQQRPTWAVYEADCEVAIATGAGNHLPVNFLDVDPWGTPWPVIEAFFTSNRRFSETLHVVVNDGTRRVLGQQKSASDQRWKTGALLEAAIEFGEELHSCYLDVCQCLLQSRAEKAGYCLSDWTGYYCGRADSMTHYWAILKQVK